MGIRLASVEFEGSGSFQGFPGLSHVAATVELPASDMRPGSSPDAVPPFLGSRAGYLCPCRAVNGPSSTPFEPFSKAMVERPSDGLPLGNTLRCSSVSFSDHFPVTGSRRSAAMIGSYRFAMNIEPMTHSSTLRKDFREDSIPALSEGAIKSHLGKPLQGHPTFLPPREEWYHARVPGQQDGTMSSVGRTPKPGR